MQTNPTYSHNPILDGIEHIGHWFHVAAKDTVGDVVTTVRRGLEVTNEMKDQFPTLAQDSGDVIENLLSCKTLGVAIASMVAGGGVNLAADAGVLAALVVDGPALIKLFDSGAKLAQMVGSDVSTDMKIIEGKSAS